MIYRDYFVFTDYIGQSVAERRRTAPTAMHKLGDGRIIRIITLNPQPCNAPLFKGCIRVYGRDAQRLPQTCMCGILE